GAAAGEPVFPRRWSPDRDGFGWRGNSGPLAERIFRAGSGRAGNAAVARHPRAGIVERRSERFLAVHTGQAAAVGGVMQEPALLLRDIHQPPAPSWWPPAPGWWLLAGIVLVVFALVL